MIVNQQDLIIALLCVDSVPPMDSVPRVPVVTIRNVLTPQGKL